MFTTPLADIDFTKVENFCRTFQEGVRVEYKAAPVHIPKVVSSFANSVGGRWVIGIEPDPNTNMPRFPIAGMPNRPGIEEQMIQACITGIYPAITPEVKVIELAGDPTRVVTVVKVFESIEAPHAIENSTKVYIRVASVAQPYDLADIDRIAYLLKRREGPDRRREELLALAAARSPHASISPRIRVIVCPVYPKGPIISKDELLQRAEAVPRLSRGSVYIQNVRRSHNAVLSSRLGSPNLSHHFEVDANGIAFFENPLEVRSVTTRRQEFRCFNAFTFLYPIASIIRLTQQLLAGRTTNLLVRVEAFGAAGLSLLARDNFIDPALVLESSVYVDNQITASTGTILEILDSQFVAVMTDLLRQIFWAFNYVETEDFFAELLRLNGFLRDSET